MPVFDTFKKRMQRQRGEKNDVYEYENIPEKLRVQIVQIMLEILGGTEDYYDHFDHGPSPKDTYDRCVETLRRELGVFKLPPSSQYEDSVINEISVYLLNEEDTENLISAIEIICRLIERIASKIGYRNFRDAESIASDAIKEINTRFKEQGIGYEYVGEFIRIDNQIIHSEVVKPALSLLHESGYSVAQNEFIGAYEDYRKQRYEDALTDALKSLESTLKAIFDKRGWAYNKDRDTFSKLLKVAFDNDLIPSFWQSHFSALRTTLEAGVPTVRNKLGGHGAGSVHRNVPPHIVSYTLHMTASAIVFLVECDKNLP